MSFELLQPIMSILFFSVWIFVAHITVGDRHDHRDEAN